MKIRTILKNSCIKIGFHRLVLSREMSFEEIKHISTDLMIETEMFVHGAICVSYSGQCLMSSYYWRKKWQ